jgi:hypothetical protein
LAENTERKQALLRNVLFQTERQSARLWELNDLMTERPDALTLDDVAALRGLVESLGIEVVVRPVTAEGEPDIDITFNLGAMTARSWFSEEEQASTPAVTVASSRSQTQQSERNVIAVEVYLSIA